MEDVFKLNHHSGDLTLHQSNSFLCELSQKGPFSVQFILQRHNPLFLSSSSQVNFSGLKFELGSAFCEPSQKGYFLDRPQVQYK